MLASLYIPTYRLGTKLHKHILCYVVLWVMLIPSAVLSAQRLDKHTIMQRAKAFQYASLSTTAGVPLVEVTPQLCRNITIYNIGDKGFVMLSNYNMSRSVVAYSTEVAFDTIDMCDALVYWLGFYDAQIDYAVEHPELQIKAYEAKQKKALPPAVPPLLQTTWDQYPHYNQYCPSMRNIRLSNHASTGCGSTAMGQILNYFEWPKHGYGCKSYNYQNSGMANMEEWRYGTLYADFGATYYHYEEMPEFLSASNHAVATLLYQVGVSFASYYNMDGNGSTGSVMDGREQFEEHFQGNILESFIHNFGYKNSLRCNRRDETASQVLWENMAKTDLAQGHPMLYAGMDAYGSGHAFVVDGYDEQDYFHVNWGWSGRDNGFYALDLLYADEHDFNYGQMALMGIEPDYSLSNVFTVTYDRSYTLQYTVTDSAQYTVSVCRWQDGSNRMPDTLVIPSTVQFGNTFYAVTAIEDSAFAGCRTIRHIRMPEMLQSLGSRFCSGCSSLQSIEIEARQVPATPNNAFASITHRLDVTIPCGTHNAYYSNTQWATLDTLIDPCFEINNGDTNPPVYPDTNTIDNPNTDTTGVDNPHTDTTSTDTTTTGIFSTSTIVTSPFFYPNPNNGRFSVNMRESYTAMVYDAMGRVVLSQYVSNPSGRTEFYIPDATKGVYILRVTAKVGHWTQCFVVQ